MTIDVSVREMTACDGAAVLAIYEEGITTRNATFETVVPTWSVWAAGL
jgi:phosphinothricin acetyltransferase